MWLLVLVLVGLLAVGLRFRLIGGGCRRVHFGAVYDADNVLAGVFVQIREEVPIDEAKHVATFAEKVRTRRTRWRGRFRGVVSFSLLGGAILLLIGCRCSFSCSGRSGLAWFLATSQRIYYVLVCYSSELFDALPLGLVVLVETPLGAQVLGTFEEQFLQRLNNVEAAHVRVGNGRVAKVQSLQGIKH